MAFQSGAANLVAKDTNGVNDVFVRDVDGKKTRRVSTGARRAQLTVGSGSPAISGNGRYVAFHTSVADRRQAGAATARRTGRSTSTTGAPGRPGSSAGP